MGHYIGKVLSDRMNSLGIDVSTLADMTFMDIDSIVSIVENKKYYEEIDEFDMSLISSALHCEPEFFVDSYVRKKDLLFSTMNRGRDTVKSRVVKAKIQDFMSDYALVSEIMTEVK